MTFRLRIPSALYRLAIDHAGGEGPLSALLRAHLDRLISGQTEAQQAGARGGHARAQALSPERRREIASQASRARWTHADVAALLARHDRQREAPVAGSGARTPPPASPRR